MPRYLINASRLNQTLDELGHLGESPDGMDRVAYSPEDIAGREDTTALMEQARLEGPPDPPASITHRRRVPSPHA